MKNTHRNVVDAIARWIVGGHQIAGSSLPTEPEICAKLGVSRTVVREAVKTLAAKGLLTTGPRVGTRVVAPHQWHLFDPDVITWRVEAGIDETFIRDIIELRLAIEPYAAGLAAARTDPQDIDVLRAAYADMVRAIGGQGSYLEADLRFHGAILKATHNQFLAGIVPLVNAVLRVSFRLSVKSRQSAISSLPLHLAVLTAIEAGDRSGAERALDVLIRSAQSDIESDMAGDNFLQEECP
jgi:DNA-binding FadR family transcriptional regulator